MSRKKARRFAVRRSKPKNAVRRPLNTQLGMLVIELGQPPAGTPADLAKTLDREWFRSHPLRSHRLRRPIAGEFTDGSAENWVVVRQLQPGVRLRLPFYALWRSRRKRHQSTSPTRCTISWRRPRPERSSVTK
jgi:hypothetical protein